MLLGCGIVNELSIDKTLASDEALGINEVLDTLGEEMG
jgi:hypothetical protein